MKAILELNQFQRIIDIDQPLPYIHCMYLDPGKVGLIEKEIDPSQIDESVIIFKLEGEIGEFLLYKYMG